MLETASDRLALSARGYHRVIKVARTIADLDGDPAVQGPHVAEALRYRVHAGHRQQAIATEDRGPLRPQD